MKKASFQVDQYGRSGTSDCARTAAAPTADTNEGLNYLDRHPVSEGDTVLIECRLPADSPVWLRTLTQEFAQLVIRIAPIVRDMERDGETLTHRNQLMRELADWTRVEGKKFERTESKVELAEAEARQSEATQSQARGQ